MTYLLDVNVLIALLDPAHIQHDTAHAWFAEEGHTAWATCPLTENGVLRIIGHPRYPNSPGSPAAGRDDVNAVFWAWGADPPHKVRVVDDFGRLPNDGWSWRRP